MTVDIPEGFAFVEGRSRDNARALLAAADEVGISQYTVKAVDGGYLAPVEVAEAYTNPSPEPDEEETEASEEPATETEEAAVPDDSWKNADIEAYAEANKIDLGDATKKADMLAAISAVKEEEE